MAPHPSPTDRTASHRTGCRIEQATHHRKDCLRPAASPPRYRSPQSPPERERLYRCLPTPPLPFTNLRLSPRRKLLQRNLDHPLPRNLPSAKRYTATPLPVSPSFSPSGSLVEAMLAYTCLPSLLNASPEYSVCFAVLASVRSSGKSATLPVLRIQHRQRLHISRLERPVPRVDRHHVSPIRRHGNRDRQRCSAASGRRAQAPSSACSSAGQFVSQLPAQLLAPSRLHPKLTRTTESRCNYESRISIPRKYQIPSSYRALQNSYNRLIP